MVVEVDGQYVRLDGFSSDSQNTKRIINKSKLTAEILEAKNFAKFPEDLQETLKAFPKAQVFTYNLTLRVEEKRKHDTPIQGFV